MLAWWLYDFKGIRTSIAKKTYIFVIFQGGGGGSDPLFPPLDPHMPCIEFCGLVLAAECLYSILLFVSIYMHASFVLSLVRNQ